ncbi:hypothetical protein GGR58DRAFT_505579 [Xylaria digitata]|nr:hypothetical protein GGR58DRAFT_505579 [Xylaria digitata]
MGSKKEKGESRENSHGRPSSSTSSSSLNPKASEFGSTGPTEHQPKHNQQEYTWQQGNGQGQHRIPPVGPSAHGRTSRGRGKAQHTIYTPPQISPVSQYSQQYQIQPMMPWVFPPLPSMPSTGGGEGFQPIYPMTQYSQYGSAPMSAPSIPLPMQFYGGQQPQYPSLRQPPTNYGQTPRFSQNMATPPRPTTQAQVPTSAGSRSSKTSRSSPAQSSPEQSHKPEVKEDKISKYRREFEVARSFGDDRKFIPNVDPLGCKRILR